MEEEVVEHRGDAIDHGWVDEDGLDVARHHLEDLHRLTAHQVVK